MLILHLHRPWFEAIAMGYKRYEFREVTPYWKKRLEGREYDQVLLHNGYHPTDPMLVMAYEGYEQVEVAGRPYYKLQLGAVHEVRNYELPPAESLLPAADCMDLNQCFGPKSHGECMYRCRDSKRWLPKPRPPPPMTISLEPSSKSSEHNVLGREIGRIVL